MNRQAAPLKPASDAVIIDTTTLSIEQVTSEVMNWVDQRIDNK
jgi:cytidylate kinase